MTNETFHIGRRSRRAIIAGLYLLADHAHDGWDNPTVLEVGEEFTDLEPPTEAEIADLIPVMSENTAPAPPTLQDRLEALGDDCREEVGVERPGVLARGRGYAVVNSAPGVWAVNLPDGRGVLSGFRGERAAWLAADAHATKARPQ